MSVPPDLMKLMAGGGGASAPGAAPAGGAPAGGPMATPQPKEGNTQAAMVKISAATKMLEQALQLVGSLTPEGKSISQALGTLIKKFGAEAAKADQLIPAELMNLVQSLPGAGGGSPIAKAVGGLPPTQPAVPTAPAA